MTLNDFRQMVAAAKTTTLSPAVIDQLRALVASEINGDLTQAEEYRRLRIEAALVLSKRRDAGALPGLLDGLRDLIGVVRMAAAEGLGKIGDAMAVPALVNALSDEDWYVQVAAAEALGKIGDASAVPGLVAALRDAKPGVRVAAARALGRLKNADAVPGLLVALPTANAELHEVIREALNGMRDRRAVPGLVAALHHENEWVQKTAANTLAYLGEEAVPGLLEALPGAEARARWLIVAILGEIRAPVAVPALIEALSDAAAPFAWTEARVCDCAAAALEGIATPEALAAVQQWREASGPP